MQINENNLNASSYHSIKNHYEVYNFHKRRRKVRASLLTRKFQTQNWTQIKAVSSLAEGFSMANKQRKSPWSEALTDINYYRVFVLLSLANEASSAL